VTLPVGYIAENRFQDPQALLRSGKNDFVETPAAGRVFTGYKAPGNGGLGNLRAGYLEMSNVDMGQEFTDMIRAQRGLQANSRVITTSDEVLQDLIQLKR
jgi:flagellar hook protein FlgE